MRNSRYFLCVIIFIFSGKIDLPGQEEHIHLEIGYASYAINQLRELGDYPASLNTLPLTESADYPPYLHNGLAYSKRWTGYSAGFYYAHGAGCSSEMINPGPTQFK